MKVLVAVRIAVIVSVMPVGLPVLRPHHLGFMRALFVACVGIAPIWIHPQDGGCGHRTLLHVPASRAGHGIFTRAHGAPVAKLTTSVATIHIQRHWFLPRQKTEDAPRRCDLQCPGALPCQFVTATLDLGTEGFGPAALGLISKSKISVGIASVQQALGMSTMPLMRPSTGAVPRII